MMENFQRCFPLSSAPFGRVVRVGKNQGPRRHQQFEVGCFHDDQWQLSAQRYSQFMYQCVAASPVNCRGCLVNDNRLLLVHLRTRYSVSNIQSAIVIDALSF